jgi:hypothetical protein
LLVAKKSKGAEAESIESAAIAAAIADLPPTRDGTRAMFTLTAGALKLIDTAVLVDGGDRSSVVEGLVNAHLSSYYSGRRSAD